MIDAAKEFPNFVKDLPAFWNLSFHKHTPLSPQLGRVGYRRGPSRFTGGINPERGS